MSEVLDLRVPLTRLETTRICNLQQPRGSRSRQCRNSVALRCLALLGVDQHDPGHT